MRVPVIYNRTIRHPAHPFRTPYNKYGHNNMAHALNSLHRNTNFVPQQVLIG